MNLESLNIQLELQGDLAGKAVLINGRKTHIRLWRMGNSWGDEMLSFELTLADRTERITRMPQIYTRNVPSSVEVMPSGRYDVPFNLRDGSWEPALLIHRMPQSGVWLTAVFIVQESAEALAHGVWIGELRSQPVRLESFDGR